MSANGIRTTLATGWLALCACIGAAPARSQEGAAPAPVEQAAQGATGREPARWDLPRLFYEPRQRRNLDAQDRSVRLGLTAASPSTAGPRFDGWVTSPAGTHAWVSGTPYLADRSGRLHPAAQRAAESGADDMENAQAQFDRARGVLVVHREAEGSVKLRVGEADNPPEAAPAGSEAAPPAAAERR
jgi:hypothetical protein